MTRRRERRSATDLRAFRLRSDFWILFVGVVYFFLPPQGILAVASSEEFTFDRYDIFIGTAMRQTVLTGHLLGGDMMELAVVNIREDDDRILRIFTFGDDGWVSKIETTLPSSVLFVDVANINGRDRLIAYEPSGLSWFEPESATMRKLVKVTTNYNVTSDGLGYAGSGTKGPADEGEIPNIDISRDLNHDGLDDLVLPDVDGFWISIQKSDGSFTDVVKLGPPEPFQDAIALGDTRSYGEVGISPLTVPWYLSRVYEMDYNQDGRSDLVFWNEDHFDVHLQDERGQFSREAVSFTCDVPFDTDGAYSNIFGYADGNAFSLLVGFRRKTERTMLIAIRDMNGDGYADFLTHTLKGRSILRQQSRYAVYLGKPSSAGIVFERHASATIQPRGKRGGMEHGGYSSLWLMDIDGDGQVDILRGDVKMGTRAMVRALVGDSITMGAEVYRMEDGVYPDHATTKRMLKADVDFSGGRDAGFAPFVLVGDVNGDNRSDVLAGKNRGEMHVFLGVPRSELFAEKPQRVGIPLPGDERNTWLVDLNQDNKEDVLMHFPSTTEPHRVSMLITR